MHRRLILAAVTLAVALSAAGVSIARSGGTRAATASTVVLGSAAFAGHGAEGWGTSRPHRIFNGGDPSGLVREIQWTGWGGRSAIGFGLHAIFKPHGGYYPEPVLIELRASDLGRCKPGGPPTYRQLSFRVPERPEGSLGPWTLWSGAKTLCKSPF